MWIWNFSTGEQKEADSYSLSASQPSWIHEFQTQQDTLMQKNKVESDLGRHSKQLLASKGTHVWVCMHMCTHPHEHVPNHMKIARQTRCSNEASCKTLLLRPFHIPTKRQYWIYDLPVIAWSFSHGCWLSPRNYGTFSYFFHEHHFTFSSRNKDHVLQSHPAQHIFSYVQYE